MSSAADALNVARSFLGIAENPPGSNRTPIGAEYGWNGVAWCDECVSVVLRRIGLPPGPIDSAHFASCWFHVQAYKRGECGTWLGNPGAAGLRPGDQGFLGTVGQDHTFLVEAIDGDSIVTLEGNLGDAVRRGRRWISSVYGFGRPNYDGPIAPGLPPPSSTAGRPIVRFGSRGAGVLEVKKFLAGIAHAELDTSSDLFDAATDAAVRKWQQDRGLDVDGEVGPQTWGDFDAVIAYLSGLASSSSAAAAIPPFPGTVRIGSRNTTATRAVQDRLRARGWPIKADGIFGKKTESIVESFQREKGLDADGVAGPATWVALWTSAVT